MGIFTNKEGHGGHLEVVPNGQSKDYLQIKINNDNNEL